MGFGASCGIESLEEDIMRDELKTDFENAWNRTAEAINAVFSLVITLFLVAGKLAVSGLTHLQSELRGSTWIVPGR